VPRSALLQRLRSATRVAKLTAPAGSGKTYLLRAWARLPELAGSVAWVSVRQGQRDPLRFWVALIKALRSTAAGAALRPLTPAPDIDPSAAVESLLEDLRSLEQPLWVVIDNLHELRSTAALQQLELLLTEAPAQARFALASREELRIGLHRLRLDGELTEIRFEDLRFSFEEARALLRAAGARLSDRALRLLLERTEGWAAGLRLAALSLAEHPDPEGFATEFSGSERTVAEYLLAEVLERQPEPVRRLLLRTSVLDRVSGPLADLLAGVAGSEQLLRQLEDSGAFVVSLDARRSWFRYHRLFADLLAHELRRAAPAELPALHAAAAGWFAEHGHPLEAVRHAQAAEHWELAARLLSQHWISLQLSGHASTARELLACFPPHQLAADPELAALRAADELDRGSLGGAGRQLALVTARLESVPAARRGRLQAMLALLRLSLARQRADFASVATAVQQLLSATEGSAASRAQLGEDLRALALIALGVAELWWLKPDEAERHLREGVALARQIGRPFIEASGLAHWAVAGRARSYSLAADRSKEAIELIRAHGWEHEPIAGVAYAVLGSSLVWRGRLAEAEPWLRRAERTLRDEAEPAAGVILHFARAGLALAQGATDEALRAFQMAERLARLLVAPFRMPAAARAGQLQALIRSGQLERAAEALAMSDERGREGGELRIPRAMLELARGRAREATAALAPVLSRSSPVLDERIWLTQALLLEARAREALGEPSASRLALEQALDLAEPDSVLWPFLLHATAALLERQRRQRSAHPALLEEILAALPAGREPAGVEPEPLREPLTESELRLLRYLPTGLTGREIAAELQVSPNTVKTHTRHLYRKLGVRRRRNAIERARLLGLLAPPPYR
jgi:LuxR family maltose regulon positive regulatory protein